MDSLKEIVPYFEYPNEYLFARYVRSLPEFINVIIGRFNSHLSEWHSMSVSLEKLVYRAVITTYINYLRGCNKFPIVPTEIVDKLKYILSRLGITCDNPAKRNGFIQWASIEEYKLLIYAKTVNLFLAFEGYKTLEYSK